ncbi:unnamed protein product, partial (macronuclear) [Paramecium tetraurelia]
MQEMVLQKCNKERITHNTPLDQEQAQLNKFAQQKQVEITIIECYGCGQKSLFTLGLVNGTDRWKKKKHFDSLPRLSPIETIGTQMIISHQSRKRGDKINMILARTVTLERINQYEEERKKKEGLKFEDLDRKGPNQQLKEVQLRYKDANHYQQVFSPLVKLEEEQDKQVKEGKVVKSVKVKWDVEFKKWELQLQLIMRKSVWNYIRMILLLIIQRNDIQLNVSGCLEHLKECKQDQRYFLHKVVPPMILGRIYTLAPPTAMDTKEAICSKSTRFKCLSSRCSQESFEVSIDIRSTWNCQDCYQCHYCLSISEGNIVVDQLAEKINKTDVKVVRICIKQEKVLVQILNFYHCTIRCEVWTQYHQLQVFYELLDQQGELDQMDEKVFIRMRDKAQKEIIEQGGKRLKEMRFLFVLIMEATQAIEPECLLPMLKGAKLIILVGDHRQSGPQLRLAWTEVCLKDQYNQEIRPVRLQVQCRMHPELTVFPSNTFYEGTLQNGVTISDRTHSGNFPWSNKQKPMIYINVTGQEQLSASGTSNLNTQEAVAVEQTVYYLYQNTVKFNKI